MSVIRYFTYSLLVRVSLVEDLVPKSMELVNAIVVLEREIVSSLVTVLEFSAEEGFTVKWLVDIAIVVDQKAERI